LTLSFYADCRPKKAVFKPLKRKPYRWRHFAERAVLKLSKNILNKNATKIASGENSQNICEYSRSSKFV
jgi:hypothetical protein